MCVCVCVCVCVCLCQVKILFNDGSLNKHFTCFLTSSHHNNKLRGGRGGGGELQERTNKRECACVHVCYTFLTQQ